MAAFSFSVSLSLNPGQHFLDSDIDKSAEIIGGLLENVPKIHIKKRGEVNYEHNSISVEIAWTETVCDGPKSPTYTREVLLSDELAKKGILISDESNNNEEEIVSSGAVEEEL